MKGTARLRGGNRYLRMQESACLNAETFKNSKAPTSRRGFLALNPFKLAKSVKFLMILLLFLLDFAYLCRH